MIERGLDHRLGRRAAELLKDMLFHRAGVDADADRDMPRLGGLHDRVHTVRPADVARVEPNLIHARLDGREREPVVKMDVRHDRYGRAGADLAERFRRLRVRHRAAHDVAARVRQRADLCQRRFRVARIRVGHGLYRNGRAAADEHIAHPDLFGLFHILSLPLPPVGGPPVIRPQQCAEYPVR